MRMMRTCLFVTEGQVRIMRKADGLDCHVRARPVSHCRQRLVYPKNSLLFE